MRSWLPFNWRTLSVQMVSSFVLLVLLTAVAVGVPAIWLIRSQSENQAWAQVEQGSRATQALLDATLKEVDGLALLTAQRPTLPELIIQENPAELESFLETLQDGTELDLLLVCNPAQQKVALIGDESGASFCALPDPTGFYIAPPEVTQRFWLLAAEQIEDSGDGLGFVVVGVAIDNLFAKQMKNQTGLEHLFLLNDELLAASITPTTAVSFANLMTRENGEDFPRTTFSIDGHPYYATRLDLGQTKVVDAVALEVTNMTQTQQRLVGIMATSIILAVLAGSIVGVMLARGIGRPLSKLSQAAAIFSSQELDTAVTVHSQVHEVSLVAQALEQARIDLQRTLTELRQTNAWNDHLLESIAEGIVILDENGRFTFFSPGAERITGYTQPQVIGQLADNILHLADIDEPLSHIMPKSGQAYKITLELADERQVTVAMTSAHLSLPSIGKAGTALVFRDISDTERIHHLLGQFLANITHEFRTPLSALAASTELLMDQASELTPVELQELLNSLHLGVLGLQTLIDNLLESASLEAGRFRVYPRSTDLGAIIVEAVNTMKPLQEKYAQQLWLALPDLIPTVQADPRRIAQVLVNLLSNAIKYSPDGTEIGLTVAEEESFVRVAIADCGSGVPLGYRPNLFRRLVHPGVESSKAQYGVGLGLSVVKAIVEAHGGQVGVEDRAQGGSIFWFTVPKGIAK